jgi:sulfatase maturation enzyme AslB (radical SAM superfamily)
MTYIKKLKPHEFNIWHGKKPLLGQLDIELTERCNNNCIHCCINLPEDDANARNREMSTDFVKDVIKQAADLGCLNVRFTGGEPLLRQDLAELYEFTRRLGMQVILFTNARLITPELAALLAKIPPGRVVEVTVYGMSPESYDRAVGRKGAFAEFRRGVALLEQHQIPFIVKAALLPFLKDDLAEFETWAQTIPRMDKSPGYSMNFDLRSRRDDPAKNARIAKLRATPEETVGMMSRNQCPAKSWMEHGTLDTPVEYLCSVAHAQARHLGLITDNVVGAGGGWEALLPLLPASVAMALVLIGSEVFQSIGKCVRTA